MKKVSVECRNIRLSYGNTEVLKDVSISIEPGEFFALLGPSGSGKSTLLRLIAGFNRHSAGQLLVDGKDISAIPPWNRNIGMVFQNYALWPHMTVWDNVAFGLVERKLPREQIRAKVEAALDGKPIGEHRYTLERGADGAPQRVLSDARFDVRLLGIPVYRYRHQAQERWQGGCLQAIQADTDEHWQQYDAVATRSYGHPVGDIPLLRHHADRGGRVGKGGRFGYRLNATHDEGNTYNGGSLYQDSVSLALDARLTDRLTWDFQSIYQDRKAIRQEPTIYAGAMAGTELPSPVRNDDGTMVGEGPYADNKFRFYSTGLKYRLSDDWTLRADYSYSSTRTRRNESVLFLQNQAGDYDDYRSDYGEAYAYNQWQGMVEGRFATGPLKHQVVAGASDDSAIWSISS